MEAVAERLYSLEEYFAFCELHEGRFEFVNGEIIEMAGETLTANQVAGNIHFHLRGNLLGQSYLFMQNGTKICVEEGKIFRIPDFFICEKEGNEKLYTNSPLLIVEVLSESTAHTDRTAKRHEYSQIQSLLYYLIVAQENLLVEVYARDSNRWCVESYTEPNDVISLPFFNTTLPVKAIYDGVDF